MLKLLLKLVLIRLQHNIIDFTIEYSLTGNELSLIFFDREIITVGTGYEPVAYKALLEKE